MKNKEKTAEMSGRQLTLRIIAFAVTLVIAVAAFSYGITRMGHKDEGYYTIEPEASGEAFLYGSGFTFKYYFSGKSNDIKSGIKRVTAEYSAVLLRMYKLLDAVNEYDGYTNLATINKFENDTFKLSDELYDVLCDAWKKTCDNMGYNMFAGSLYKEWESIRYSINPERFDPLNEESGSREKLSLLAAKTAQTGNFSFEVLNEAEKTVRITVSEEYRKFISDGEYAGAVLELGILRDAYILKRVAEVLEEKGYSNGVLMSENGYAISLSEHEGGEYVMYTEKDGKSEPLKTIPIIKGQSAVIFRAFPLSEYEDGYYTYEYAGKTHYRNLYVMSNGEFSDKILSCAITDTENNVADTVYLMIGMIEMNDIDAITDSAKKSGAKILTVFADSPLDAVSN